MVCCRITFSETCLFSWLVFVQSSFNSSLQEPCKYFVTVRQYAYRPIVLDVYRVSLLEQNDYFCFMPTVGSLLCL